MWIRTKLTDVELSVALYAATGIVTRPKLMENFAVGRMGPPSSEPFGSMLGGAAAADIRCRTGCAERVAAARARPRGGGPSAQPASARTRPERTAATSAWWSRAFWSA
ncbi:hypothetical protein GCM10012285_16810 [Streptomyces kronopolitis]|uniref:Uncharacterized protein n=1 Tax=Streptomyces kronopolitis TaxID=1612435 RepID=A0ABQ2J708_9ACTN|nr:hypothetical protein GCM10012285_16810 [Streptomyces kronopolitis]